MLLYSPALAQPSISTSIPQTPTETGSEHITKIAVNPKRAVKAKPTAKMAPTATPPDDVSYGPNLITNGDFEICSVPFQADNFVVPVGMRSHEITGWHVFGKDVNLFQYKWVAQHGARCLDLNGFDIGGVEQEFATEPDASYELRLWLAGNIEGEPPIKTMYARAAGQLITWSFNSYGRSHEQLGWSPKVWRFKAKEFKTDLELGSMTKDTHAGPIIDNVSVRKVEKHEATAPVTQ